MEIKKEDGELDGYGSQTGDNQMSIPDCHPSLNNPLFFETGGQICASVFCCMQFLGLVVYYLHTFRCINAKYMTSSIFYSTFPMYIFVFMKGKARFISTPAVIRGQLGPRLSNGSLQRDCPFSGPQFHIFTCNSSAQRLFSLILPTFVATTFLFIHSKFQRKPASRKVERGTSNS